MCIISASKLKDLDVLLKYQDVNQPGTLYRNYARLQDR